MPLPSHEPDPFPDQHIRIWPDLQFKNLELLSIYEENMQGK
jgi:hypothetical protein